MPKPGTQAPELVVETLQGTLWKLSEQKPVSFTLIVFYRGLHCPICRKQLQELIQKLDDFAANGVDVIAISGDQRDRAERSHKEWQLGDLRVGYSQSVESMREWGLFTSKAIKEGEPDLFGEPGLFLIRPDGTVYYEAIQSMPFARPSFDDLLGAIGFVLKNDYPPRGEA